MPTRSGCLTSIDRFDMVATAGPAADRATFAPGLRAIMPMSLPGARQTSDHARAMGAAVPSAGVGCALRATHGRGVAEERAGAPFVPPRSQGL